MMIKQDKVFQKNGFTLIESMVVLIILGLVFTLVLKNGEIYVERMKADEVKRIILSLYEAELRYKANNDLGVFTDKITDLDLTVPLSANFKEPTIVLPSSLRTRVGFISMLRKNGTYEIYVDAQGVFYCKSLCLKPELCIKMNVGNLPTGQGSCLNTVLDDGSQSAGSKGGASRK